MELAEAMLKYVIRFVMERAPEETEVSQFLCGSRAAGEAEPCGGLCFCPGHLYRGGEAAGTL